MTALLDNDPFVVACVIIICVCAAILAIFIAMGRAMPGLLDSSLDPPPNADSAVEHVRRPAP